VRNHREQQPEGALLIDRDFGEGVEEKEAGHGDGEDGGVVDIDAARRFAIKMLELNRQRLLKLEV
jgi:hypothetical protein